MRATITNTKNRIVIEHEDITKEKMIVRIRKEMENFTKQHVKIEIDNKEYSLKELGII